MPTISNGRVTLIGDAGYCASPLSGMGTSLALVGRCQDLPAGMDGYAPKSASDIAITAQVMKWVQRWPFRSYAERKWFTTADAIELPQYPDVP
jgi:hypothetical protein